MSEFDSRFRQTARKGWIRYREPQELPREASLRAGVAGAYLPRVLLDVSHRPQEAVSQSVPHAVSMVLRYRARAAGLEPPVWAEPDWLAEILGTDRGTGTPGRRLQRLRAWRLSVAFPADLQFFRDGTAQLSRHLGLGGVRLVYRWEERWLRALRESLRAGVPPVLFVDLGRLYPQWRGLPQPHAVVLSGGDGRHAWVHDPARETAPVRIGLSTLMDALLPGEPLAAFLDFKRPAPSAGSEF